MTLPSHLLPKHPLIIFVIELKTTNFGVGSTEIANIFGVSNSKDRSFMPSDCFHICEKLGFIDIESPIVSSNKNMIACVWNIDSCKVSIFLRRHDFFSKPLQSTLLSDVIWSILVL